MFLFARNQAIKGQIADYLNMVNETLHAFEAGMAHYLEHHLDDHFLTLVERTHQCESKADDLRRAVESELFEKSLLPEVREDIMHVLERLDAIPNECNLVMRRIHTHNIRLPDELDGQVRELLHLGVEGCLPLKDAVDDVLGHCTRVKELARQISSTEKVADKIEHELIYRIFRSDYSPADRLLYRDVIGWIAALPDLAEEISEQLTILAVKRNV
jgi:predicted phosphate transport protein (TIGR00153 family)